MFLSKPDNWIINNEDIKINLNIKSSETIAKFWKELIKQRLGNEIFAQK